MTFNLSEVTVSEADHVATLRIVKQGRNNVPVTFTLSTLNGTARGRYSILHCISPIYSYILKDITVNYSISRQLQYTTLYHSILQYITAYHTIPQCLVTLVTMVILVSGNCNSHMDTMYGHTQVLVILNPCLSR